MSTCFLRASERVSRLSTVEISGQVRGISGLRLTAVGLERATSIGQRCQVHGRFGPLLGEVVSIDSDCVQILPFTSWEGVTAGQQVESLEVDQVLRPSTAWIGRVLDSFGNPVDGKGPLKAGPTSQKLRASPIPAFCRRRVGKRIKTGVSGIDLFAPLCRGQRMGIFAGAGVGKSTLMAMLARCVEADVVVVGLIGERGREVQDFIQRDLGPEGLARTVMVVSTGDEAPLARRQAAWTATAIAEHFRDQGLQVFLMIDSLTRFAHAQREIGLSIGEPPAQRGYPPTTFAELPRLLERAGPGPGSAGDITAVYTVLVDGDDMDDPVADGIRGVLDGHILLDRAIAERGRFPAIDVLRSVSRMLPDCHSAVENAIVKKARLALSRYSDMEDLIRLGAYQSGSDIEVDRSVSIWAGVEEILGQTVGEVVPDENAFAVLSRLLADNGIEADQSGNVERDCAS